MSVGDILGLANDVADLAGGAITPEQFASKYNLA